MHYHSHYLTDLPHPYNKIGDGPEGPEVRVVADRLRPKILNATLQSITPIHSNKFSALDMFTPGTITSIYSYGKKLILEIAYSYAIMFSLGMTGSFQYFTESHPHDIGLFHTSTVSFVFRDSRRFGNIKLLSKSDLCCWINQELGPDILQSAVDNNSLPLETWIERFQAHSKLAVCKALLDQSIVAGIGNYLKSEILYFAAIHPETKVGQLTLEQLTDLYRCAHHIILVSYMYGGLTIESYINPDGEPGVYPRSVYGKDYDPLGRPVTAIQTSDGRRSFLVYS